MVLFVMDGYIFVTVTTMKSNAGSNYFFMDYVVLNFCADKIRCVQIQCTRFRLKLIMYEQHFRLIQIHRSL